MKKSLAVVGASAMGLGMAVAVGSPAQAADVTTACTGIDDHVVTNGTLADNWFMDCVPQYGLGKVEFTLTAAEPFPAAFVALDDPSVTSTYSGDAAAAAAYVGAAPGEPAGFDDFILNSMPADYEGDLIVPISGVQAVAPSSLPVACDPITNTYEHAYRIDYAPVTVTFSQTVDGEVWKFPVSMTSQPVYLGLNFNGVDATTSAGGLNATAPQCLILNNANVFASDSTVNVAEFNQIRNFAGGSGGSASDLFPVQLSPGYSLGEMPRFIAPPVAAAPAAPGLAETGLNDGVTNAGLIAGLGALIVGFALTIFVGRRRAA